MPVTDYTTTKAGSRVVHLIEGQGGSHIESTNSYQHVDESVRVYRVSTSTPSFGKARTSPARLPENPFEFIYERDVNWRGSQLSIPPSSMDINTFGYYYSKTTGVIPQGYSLGAEHVFSSSKISEESDRVSNKVLSKIKNQKINVAQAMAEKKKTAQTVGDAATAIAKALIALKKGNFKAAANALGVNPKRRAQSRFDHASQQGDRVASGWLALQYGWRPLINDVYGAAEQLALSHKRPDYITVRSSRKLNEPIQTTSTAFDGDVTTTHQVQGLKYLEITISITYVIQGSENLPTQLGLTNPALIAWELLPWSFVIDWFIPIGEALGNLDATVGLSFVDGYKTVFTRLNTTATLTQSGHASGNTVSKDLVGFAERVYTKRNRYDDFPSVALPQFKNPLSFEHAANALALLKTLKK